MKSLNHKGPVSEIARQDSRGLNTLRCIDGKGKVPENFHHDNSNKKNLVKKEKQCRKNEFIPNGRNKIKYINYVNLQNSYSRRNYHKRHFLNVFKNSLRKVFYEVSKLKLDTTLHKWPNGFWQRWQEHPVGKDSLTARTSGNLAAHVLEEEAGPLADTTHKNRLNVNKASTCKA